VTTWKPIPEFSRYQVTDWGQFRNAKTGKILKPSLVGDYPKISLTADSGERKTVYTGIAVLAAFIGELPDGAVVLYRDGSKQNCRLINLGYETSAERVFVVEEGDGYQLVRTTLNFGVLPVIGQCSKGHRLSLNGQPDDNTLFWGRNRVCRQCDAPNGLPEFAQYSLEFGVGQPPLLDILDRRQGNKAA
jgi:NUMOD4 motif